MPVNEEAICGTLRDAQIVEWYGAVRVSGKLYGDTKGRFADGEEVTTSAVLAIHQDAKAIVTQNSVYRLDPWPDLMRCPHCHQVFAKAQAGNLKPVETLGDFDNAHPDNVPRTGDK